MFEIWEANFDDLKHSFVPLVNVWYWANDMMITNILRSGKVSVPRRKIHIYNDKAALILSELI